jgi:inner membrane protein
VSTPIGHALGGALAASTVAGEVAWTDRRMMLRILCLALLPDVDALVLLVAPTAHRGLTHGLPFAAIAAVALTWLGRRNLPMPPRRTWLALFLAAASHPLLDYLMGAGPPIPFFAPFSERAWLSPYRIVPTAYYAKAVSGYALGWFWMLNAIAGLLEVAIFGGALVALRRGAPGRTRVLGAITAIVAFLLSARLYG